MGEHDMSATKLVAKQVTENEINFPNIKEWEKENAFYFVEVSWMYRGFLKGYKRVYTSYEYCYYRGDVENAVIFEREMVKKQ